MSFLYICLITGVLGFFKIVPEPICIAAVLIGIVHNLHTRALLCDLAIYWDLLTTFNNMAQMVATILTGVLGGILLKWDYRGILYLCYQFVLAGDLVGFEATNHNIRRAVTVIWVTYLIQFALTIFFFNFGLVPDTDINSVLFSVTVDNKVIPFTTLSVFTQTITTNMLMVMSHIVFNHQWINRLPNATVRLEGIDDPDSTPLEKLDHVGGFVRKFRPDNR